MNEEKQIQNLIATWEKASAEGDFQTLIDLVWDDVVFMFVGRPAFGKEEFEKSLKIMKEKNIRIRGKSDIEEIKIIGNWAFARLKVKFITSSPETTTYESGYVLPIYKKTDDGKWKLKRDANLLSPDKE